MAENEMTIEDLTDMIVDDIGPMFVGLETSTIIPALINVAAFVAMTSLKCDQKAALRMIADTCEAGIVLLEAPDH
jgi:hypothetical protein